MRVSESTAGAPLRERQNSHWNGRTAAVFFPSNQSARRWTATSASLPSMAPTGRSSRTSRRVAALVNCIAATRRNRRLGDRHPRYNDAPELQRYCPARPPEVPEPRRIDLPSTQPESRTRPACDGPKRSLLEDLFVRPDRSKHPVTADVPWQPTTAVHSKPAHP